MFDSKNSSCRVGVSGRRKARCRTGSMLLLGTLAAFVLSLGSLAIIKSHSRRIAMTNAETASAQSRLTSVGLLQRSVALLQNDPLYQGTVIDRGAAIAEAYAEVSSISPTSTRIDIFLYRRAPVPAATKTVDPTSL